MMIYLICFAVFVLVMAAMSVGVMLGRAPLAPRCNARVCCREAGVAGRRCSREPGEDCR